MSDVFLDEPLDTEGKAYLDELHAYLDRIGNEQGFVDPEPEEDSHGGKPPLRALSFPVETRYQSPNFYTPAETKAKWGLTRTFTEITIHHWGSTGQQFDNVVSWLCNKTAQASAHYVVGGGRVARLVSEANVAWTNGSRAGNAQAITIECRPEATDEDYRLVAELVKDIRSRRGDLPIRPHRVWTSTACPGRWDLIRLDRLARAGSVWACTKVLWRGAVQCAHSIPKLDLLALTTPNDILITLIQGAFTGATSASAGTHSGGGAGDHKGSGYSWTLMGVAETAGRKVWLLLFRRRYVAGLWSQHGHYLDPECPRLSKEAQAQFYLFEKGYDALVGNNRDTGYRTNAGEIMRLFKSRLTIDPVPSGPGGTLEEIMALTAKEEEFAQRVSALTAAKTIGKRLPDEKGAQLQWHIYNANVKAGRAQNSAERIEAVVARIEALLKDPSAVADAIAARLKDAGPISQEMLTEAVKAAFADAFATEPRALGEDDEAALAMDARFPDQDEEFDRLNAEPVAPRED